MSEKKKLSPYRKFMRLLLDKFRNSHPGTTYRDVQQSDKEHKLYKLYSALFPNKTERGKRTNMMFYLDNLRGTMREDGGWKRLRFVQPVPEPASA